MSKAKACRLNVQYFDPNVLCDQAATVYLNGKRGTGKTKLIADLLAYLRFCATCIVICPTVEASKTYAQHVPELFIYRKWAPEIVDKIVEAQMALGDDVAKYPCVIIFDDCLFDPKFAKHVSTRNLYMNGRHANITVICAGQYMMDLPPAIRTNTDYVFMLTENCVSNQRRLYTNFGGVFDTFKDFRECFTQIAVDYNAMVINNKCLSSKVQDCVFYYKATLGLRFRVGHKALWQYANNKNSKDDDWGKEELVPFENAQRPSLVVRHGPKPGGGRDDEGSSPRSVADF